MDERRVNAGAFGLVGDVSFRALARAWRGPGAGLARAWRGPGSGLTRAGRGPRSGHDF